MERHDLDGIQAFRMLGESSQTTNMKLHQVAVWLVDHRRGL
ncbi:ANTAR domain-containing protein [Amycolatopsis carbonis]